MSEPNFGRSVASEFVGTTLVMLGGPGLMVLGGADLDRLAIAVGFGASLAIAIGVIGAVTNPMFSLALWFARAITGRELASDIVGQVLGAIFGAFVIFCLNNTTRFAGGTNGWEPSTDVVGGVDLGIHLTGFANLGVVLAAELVLGTLLVIIMLSSITQQRSNATMAAFVGAGYTVAMLFLIPVSGGGVHPARSLAMAIFADTNPNALGQLWPFIVVPVLASVVGLLAWLAIDEASVDDTVFNDTIVESAIDVATGD
ncbi:MAG TPA: aquaporin [Ilumatobacter sp.]|nr:aquaporin [Ilumatobacter sp.]